MFSLVEGWLYPKTRIINLAMYQFINLSFNLNLCMFILWNVIYYVYPEIEPGLYAVVQVKPEIKENQNLINPASCRFLRVYVPSKLVINLNLSSLKMYHPEDRERVFQKCLKFYTYHYSPPFTNININIMKSNQGFMQ